MLNIISRPHIGLVQITEGYGVTVGLIWGLVGQLANYLTGRFILIRSWIVKLKKEITQYKERNTHVRGSQQCPTDEFKFGKLRFSYIQLQRVTDELLHVASSKC